MTHAWIEFFLTAFGVIVTTLLGVIWHSYQKRISKIEKSQEESNKKLDQIKEASHRREIITERLTCKIDHLCSYVFNGTWNKIKSSIEKEKHG